MTKIYSYNDIFDNVILNQADFVLCDIEGKIYSLNDVLIPRKTKFTKEIIFYDKDNLDFEKFSRISVIFYNEKNKRESIIFSFNTENKYFKELFVEYKKQILDS